MTVGVGANLALAGGPAPTVKVGAVDTPYIAGEDVTIELSATSAGAAAGAQFNLGFGVLLPADVTLVD